MIRIPDSENIIAFHVEGDEVLAHTKDRKGKVIGDDLGSRAASMAAIVAFVAADIIKIYLT